MSSAKAEEDDQRWEPTHVQVTVLRGRGLRGKGKHGTSDVYTIIQVGKEKYSTCVAEKTTSPEWREECSFELPPGALSGAGRGAPPPGTTELVLTVMHRALIGLDVFLGQAVVPLDKAFQDRMCIKNEWYKLNSKTGKKEKERGDIQVTVQFTRNNLTASMYDLVMKDKGVSTFSKLKERIRGKKRSCDEDSSSAILPGGYGALYRMRNRLPSDGGGEEEYEDDEGGEARRSKMRNFFLRGKLRKSSDTRSSTSLGSESSESSSRGGSLSPTAGISVVVSDLSNSPSNSSNLTADNSPDHTATVSPKLSPQKYEFGEEAGEITITVPQPSLCVNGSYVYNVQPQDPGSGKPAGSLGLGPLHKSLPLSISLQNLRPKAPELPKGPTGDGRRWSFDKAGEEEKAAIAAALEQSGPLQGEATEERGPGSSVSESSESQGKKQKRNLFSHGRSELVGKGQSQSKVESEHAPALSAEDKQHRGWFGSKDSNNKPSPMVSPKLAPSTESHSPPHPPSQHRWCSPTTPLDPASSGSSLHRSNPFYHSQTTPPPISPCNPFFPFLQRNPFYGDMLTSEAPKPSPPPLPYLSSSRPPISRLFPKTSTPNSTAHQDWPAKEEEHPIDGTHMKERDVTKHCPLPPHSVEGMRPLSKRSSNPFMSVEAVGSDAEWDDSFEEFAAGRLQSPDDVSSECKNMSSCPLPEDSNNNGFNEIPRLSNTDTKQNLNLSEAQNPPAPDFISNTCTDNLSHGEEVTTNLPTFAQFLDSIPANILVDSDSKTPFSSVTSGPNIYVDCKLANSSTNANVAASTDVHQAPDHDCCHIHNSSSPCPQHRDNLISSVNPVFSEVSNSAEESAPSSSFPCSESEKFSVSSSQHAGAQSVDSDIPGAHEETSKPAQSGFPKGSESEKLVIDWSGDTAVGDVASERREVLSTEQMVVSSKLPPVTMKEMGTDNTYIGSSSTQDILSSDQHLNPPVSLQSDTEKREDGLCDLKESVVDFLEEVNDSTITANNSAGTVYVSATSEEVSTLPSFCVMSSSPVDRQSQFETLLDSNRIGHISPKSERLFSQTFNTSFTGNSPDQSPDDTLLHTVVSQRSPSSFLCSLYLSADSQYYQSCQSHLSSKCSNTSEGTDEEALPSANSTLCGEQTCDNTGEFQFAVDTKCSAALSLGDPINPCGQSNDGINQIEGSELIHPEAVCLLKDRAAPFEPSFSIVDYVGLQTLPSARTGSCISFNPKDYNLCKGSGEDGLVQLDKSLSDSPTQHAALHRSHSEGALRTSFKEHLMPSLGSDPGVMHDPSAQSSSDLFLPASSAPLLTVESSPPLAPCLLPNAALVSSPPSPTLATAPALCTAQPKTDASHAVLPTETQQQADDQQNSPHPVKPLTTAMLAEEKRTEGRSVLASGLEKLKSTISPGRSSQLSEELQCKKPLTEGAGSYYHLTHSELVALLVQREAELERQKDAFERQRVLLAKREVELKKLKPQVRDLEDYIDTLLVRIMEQTPTLLQVRSKLK